jgi:hypothetical protein
MKIRKLRKILKTNLSVTRSENKILISTPFIIGIISISKEGINVQTELKPYFTLEIIRIQKLLNTPKVFSQLDEIFDGNDEIENPIKRFYIEEGILKYCITDEQHSDIDSTGKFLPENHYFITPEQAIEKAQHVLNFKKEFLSDVIAELQANLEDNQIKLEMVEKQIHNLTLISLEKE